MMNFLTNITNKAASIMGLEGSRQDLEQIATRSLIEEATNGGFALANYLHYRYFDEEEGLFFLSDDACGFMLEISLIVGVDEALVKNLNYFFNREMPENSWMQFLLVASHQVDGLLGNWSEGRKNPHPWLKKITAKRINFVRALANNFAESDGRIARNFKVYINFSQRNVKTKQSILAIKAFRKILIKKLETINLSVGLCDSKDLSALIRELLEMEQGINRPNYRINNPHATLNEQISSAGHSYKLENDYFLNTKTNIATKVYYAEELPSNGSLWSMIDLLGDSGQHNLVIPARFVISYTVATSEQSQGIYSARGNGVISAAEQFYSRNNRDLQREAVEWKDIIDKEKSHQRYLTENFCVLLSSPKDFIEEAEQSLLSLYRYNDWQLAKANHFHLPAILALLPLQQSYYWPALKLVKLLRVCQGDEVVAKLPIHGEWKGVPMPGVLFFARRGQLFQWNPFYRIESGNYNVCVFGPAGGGKSVLLQEIATTIAAANGRVFILDIGQSFAESAKLLDGEIIQFGKKARLALNPFAIFHENMDKDEFMELVKCAKELLVIMCGVDNDRGAAELERAIITALQESSYLIDINGFTEFLGRSGSELLKQYAVTLFSYTKEGIYGKYFTGDKSAGFKEIITIFEFEEIKKDKKLLAIILQILVMEITKQFFTGDRSKQFIIIVDEAWMLLDYSAGFFAEFARTVRKYGGSLVTCVQNYSDLHKTSQHRTILENSTWTILLKQDEKGLHVFSESEAFKDKLPLIKSISLVPGKYAEMLISATGVSVVGRLVLDDYSQALYSTDAADFNFLKKAEEQGIGLDGAIEQLARIKSDRREGRRR